jgi:endonuclease IV
MQQPVKERIAKMREEIAQISEANRQCLQGGKKMAGSSSEQERRLQRLQEILDELVALTDWRKL